MEVEYFCCLYLEEMSNYSVSMVNLFLHIYHSNTGALCTAVANLLLPGNGCFPCNKARWANVRPGWPNFATFSQRGANG